MPVGTADQPPVRLARRSSAISLATLVRRTAAADRTA